MGETPLMSPLRHFQELAEGLFHDFSSFGGFSVAVFLVISRPTLREWTEQRSKNIRLWRGVNHPPFIHGYKHLTKYKELVMSIVIEFMSAFAAQYFHDTMKITV